MTNGFCVRMDSWNKHIPSSIHMCSDIHIRSRRECVVSKGPFGRKRTKDLTFNNSCQSHDEFLRMCIHICSTVRMCSNIHIRTRSKCVGFMGLFRRETTIELTLKNSCQSHVAF